MSIKLVAETQCDFRATKSRMVANEWLTFVANGRKRKVFAKSESESFDKCMKVASDPHAQKKAAQFVPINITSRMICIVNLKKPLS